MNEFVRALLVVFSLLGLTASASAQVEFAVPQVEVEARVVVLSSSNPSAGGIRFGPSFAALPGDQLTTQLFLNPGMHGLSDFAVSCQFDFNLNDELNIVSIQNLNGSSGPASTQESDGSQEGIIETISGSFAPPLTPFGPDTPIAEIVFDVNTPLDDGPDIHCGLFAAPDDYLRDAAGVDVDPNQLDFPGTILNEQRQDWAPTFAAPLSNYPIGIDIGPGSRSIKVKTGPICKNDCPNKERGLSFQSTEPGFAFALSPVQVNGLVITNTVSMDVDVSGLDGTGSFFALELDTPFVPIGGQFDNFLFLSVERESNGDLSVFADQKLNGGSVTPIGTPVPVPGDTETVRFDLSWASGQVHFDAGPLGGPMSHALNGHPFVFDTSAGIGVGMSSSQKGDKAGTTIEISGDLSMGGRTMALDDLKALIELELAASKDLDGAGLDVKKMKAAKKKLQRAIEKLKLGDKKVPVTDPPTFENPLIQKAYMEVQSVAGDKVGKDTKKRLEKAAKRDEMAIKRIDKAIKRITDGKSTTKVPKDLDTARKFIDKGKDEKLKTKALLETLVKKETKGV